MNPSRSEILAGKHGEGLRRALLAAEERDRGRAKEPGKNPVREGLTAPIQRPGRATQRALAEQFAHEEFLDVLEMRRYPDRTPGLWNLDFVFVRELAWALDADPPREYRADFGFPRARLLVEIKGGAHAAGKGKQRADVEREALTVVLGWRLLPVTPEMVRDGRAIDAVREVLVAALG